MELSDGLQRVLTEYVAARTKPLTSHPLAAAIRGDIAARVAEIVGDGYKVTGSPGQGNWAETPWIAVFDPTITTSAQRGFYVVYLFREDGQAVYLSLNQATTEVYETVGGKQYLSVLMNRASVDAQLIQPHGLEGLDVGPLDLPGTGHLTRGYNAGNIVAATYHRTAVPGDAVLAADLQRFMTLYAGLIDARESVDESTGEELPPGVEPGTEAKKFRWHRRAERNPKLARQAKEFHGLTCKVCGFNFETTYGKHGAGYIEAHHLVPFATLAKRPEAVVLDPATDFTVVCANCHRMLHRAPAPSVENLVKKLNPTSSDR